MELLDYAVAIDEIMQLKPIQVIPGVVDRWIVRFQYSEVVDGRFLRGDYADEKDVEDSLADYARQIAGKTLQWSYKRDEPKTLKVPANLTHTRGYRPEGLKTTDYP